MSTAGQMGATRQTVSSLQSLCTRNMEHARPIKTSNKTDLDPGGSGAVLSQRAQGRRNRPVAALYPTTMNSRPLLCNAASERSGCTEATHIYRRFGIAPATGLAVTSQVVLRRSGLWQNSTDDDRLWHRGRMDSRGNRGPASLLSVATACGHHVGSDCRHRSLGRWHTANYNQESALHHPCGLSKGLELRALSCGGYVSRAGGKAVPSYAHFSLESAAEHASTRRLGFEHSQQCPPVPAPPASGPRRRATISTL